MVVAYPAGWLAMHVPHYDVLVLGGGSAGCVLAGPAAVVTFIADCRLRRLVRLSDR